MSRKLLTADDVRQLLAEAVDKTGPQSAARQAGVSRQFIHKVLAGEAPPGDKLPEWLGLEPVEMRWRKKPRRPVTGRPRKGKS